MAFAIDAVSVFGVSGDGNGAFVDDGAADVGVDADGITAVITLDGDGCAGVIGNGAGGRAVHAVRRARAEVADGDAPDAPVYAVRRVLYVRSVLYAVYVFALFCAACNVYGGLICQSKLGVGAFWGTVAIIFNISGFTRDNTIFSFTLRTVGSGWAAVMRKSAVAGASTVSQDISFACIAADNIFTS